MDGERLIPEHRRAAVDEALRAVLGAHRPTGIRPIKGGASGATILRLEAGRRSYVLRLEPERIALADRQRGYDCMMAAAEAGAAPALSYGNAEAGVAVMSFIEAQPLSAFPGGRRALIEALGVLFSRVRSAAAFPALPDYPEVAGWMLQGVEAAGLVAPALLAPHAAALAHIRERLPWDRSRFTPSHNDPNPRNLIFDGVRLWLVDWELAAMNDPLVDVAIGTTEYAQEPELEDLLLRSTFGREPSRQLKARLAIVRLLTRIFYGAIVLDSVTGQVSAGPETSLDAFTPEGFREAVADGRLGGGTPETVMAFAKMSLRAFLDGVNAPEFEDTLSLAAEA